LHSAAAFVARALFARAVFRNDSAERRRIDAYLGGAPGVFVEVGANDPVGGSQTLALEWRGWTGILVEPLREYAYRLRKMRRAQVFDCAAGSPAQAGRSLPFLVAGSLSTLLPRIEERVTPRETRLVRVRTLDAILADARIGPIDFLSIDVEGAELDVLAGFTIERHRPRLILLEDNVRNRDKHSYMTARGYKLIRRTNLNNWYVPQDAAFPVSLFGRWQLLRKLYLGTALRRSKLPRIRKRFSLWMAGECVSRYPESRT
jgi:FkbM family methyltransferase